MNCHIIIVINAEYSLFTAVLSLTGISTALWLHTHTHFSYNGQGIE